MRKASELTLDAKSAEWCRSIGRADREAYPRGAGVRAERLCPFSEGTPHRLAWYEGWKGA